MDQHSEKAASFDQWGIVEVMGHKKFAGHITEQVIAGSALVRVDVPEVVVERARSWNYSNEPREVEKKTVGAFTKMVGVGSIYCITPTTEEVARKCAAELAKYDSDPIPVALPAERQLAAVSSSADRDDDAGGDLSYDDDDELPL